MTFLTRIQLLTTIVMFATVTICSAAGSSSDQLFGSGQGYFHPSLDVKTEYSDNYLAVPDNEESDWETTVSPGLWIALPASHKKVFRIVSTNAAPGGQGVSSFQDADYKGFQGSLMYNADFVRSHGHSDQDLTKQRGQGVIQYTFASGFSLEASDVYIQSAEEQADTPGTELEKYASNLVNVIAFYKVSPKLKMRVGYSNFNLDYTSGLNTAFKERTDDQVSAYLIYKIMPKTELFVQYDNITIDYDEDLVADSDEQHIFVGLKFNTNARISGHVKFGYGLIDTDLAQNEKFEDYIGDAALKYAFGGGSSVTLSGKQIVNVTSDVNYQNILHNEIGLAFTQKLASKVDLTLSATYKEDEYRVDDKLSIREDEDRVAGVKLSYALNEWCKLGANYTYTDRDSNIDSNEYQENKVMFTVSAAF